MKLKREALAEVDYQRTVELSSSQDLQPLKIEASRRLDHLKSINFFKKPQSHGDTEQASSGR